MTKIIYFLAIMFIVSSCKHKTTDQVAVCSGDAYYQLCMASAELEAFDQILIGYYKQMELNPVEVIKKTDSLLRDIKRRPDVNNVRWNKYGSLYDLRAETFYRMGLYQQSIAEIYKGEKNDRETLGGEFYLGDNEQIHLACNYVKLRGFKKAKGFLDSAGKAFYITDYVVANYHEVMGSKEKALDAYLNIVKEEDLDHYSFYQDALKRIEELQKTNPQLLSELYYPSDRPDKEICQTDNAIRSKIFDLVHKIPEVKVCKTCDMVLIYKEPKKTKTSKYWVKVGQANGIDIITKYEFYIDTLTLQVTYFDATTKKEKTLNEWRQRR